MHELHALPDDTRQRLQDFLDQDVNTLDYIATHGFLCSLVVGPVEPPVEEWISALCDGETLSDNETIRNEVIADLVAWKKEIHARLYHGQSVELPCPLTVKTRDTTDLNNWCMGFMEGMYLREEEWYAGDEDLIADLTLPMVVLSDIIDDPDLQQIRGDIKLSRELAQQIPDVLTEMYLHFHAPAV